MKESYRNHHQGIGDAFEKSCELNKPSANSDARLVLVQMVRAYMDAEMGGVIVRNTSNNYFLALDFCAPPQKSPNGDPMIQVRYTCPVEMGRAENFLRDENVLVLEVPDDVVKNIDQHIRKTVLGTGNFDKSSGCELYQGSFGPMKA